MDHGYLIMVLRDKLRLFVVSILMVLILIVSFLNLGNWLILKTEVPVSADYIYVFAGDGNFNRETAGVTLGISYHDPVLIVDSLWYNKHIVNNVRAKHLISKLEKMQVEVIGPSSSTYDEISNLKNWLKDKGDFKKNLILISSPYHMRRISLICQKLKLHKYVSYHLLAFNVDNSKNYKYAPARWWKAKKNRERTLSEYFKMFIILFKG